MSQTVSISMQQSLPYYFPHQYYTTTSTTQQTYSPVQALFQPPPFLQQLVLSGPASSTTSSAFHPGSPSAFQAASPLHVHQPQPTHSTPSALSSAASAVALGLCCVSTVHSIKQSRTLTSSPSTQLQSSSESSEEAVAFVHQPRPPSTIRVATNSKAAASAPDSVQFMTRSTIPSTAKKRQRSSDNNSRNNHAIKLKSRRTSKSKSSDDDGSSTDSSAFTSGEQVAITVNWPNQIINPARAN